MKKYLVSIIAIVTALCFSGCDKEDEVVIAPSAIPQEVQAFLGSHFAGIEIKHVIQEKERSSYDYELLLADGTRIEINREGEWIEVENHQKGVPNSIVPSSILEYVNTNYPEITIVDIERDRHIDVKLKNGTEMEFTTNGDFIRIDF